MSDRTHLLRKRIAQSFNKEPQELNVLINLLTEAGFRLHIHTNSKSPQPFCHREINMGIDMLLNIFAFRE